MYQIRKTYLAPVVILIVMLTFLLAKGVESAYTIPFMEAQIAEGTMGRIELTAMGGNLLRVNSFYIDGKRVEDCTVEKMTYDQCRVLLDPSAFNKGNTWYELRLGYNKWGFINLLSSPVWIEWTGS